MNWCRENPENIRSRCEEITFVEENSGQNSYIDMQLMSYCKNIILAVKSSFSYLAALLHRNESKVVVNRTGREV